MSDTFVVDNEGKPSDLPAPEPEAKAVEPKPEDDAAPEVKAEGEEDAGETPAPDDGDDTADDEDEDEAPKKRRNRVDAGKRIGQLTAKVRGLERQIAQGLVRPEPANPAAMPKQENFEAYEDYIDARAEHVAEQAFAKHERATREANQRVQMQRTADDFRERSDAAAAKYDDFDEVIEASEVPITNAIGHAIMESEVGPDISYYLAKHPAEARKIVALSPVSQAREIGKIEAKLSAPVTPAPKKTTAAPAPPKTLRPGAKPVVNPDKIPINDFVEQERKRLKAKGLM